MGTLEALPWSVLCSVLLSDYIQYVMHDLIFAIFIAAFKADVVKSL